MKFVSRIAGAAAALVIVGVCAAQPTPPGYLSSAQMPDGVRLLGPPPAEGTGAKAGDVATYLATRRLVGGPRWALATQDADFGAAPMMRDFSCAVGLNLDPKSAPALFHLFSRVLADDEAVGKTAKAAYRRPRPFVEKGGDICVPQEDWLKKTYSYPSGHATFSWTAGLVLAQVAPDRAGAILSRARAYGESRVVCGVHYPSDIQAGRTAAAAVFSALQNNRSYEEDAERARAELAALRAAHAAGPAASACQAEADAAATPIW